MALLTGCGGTADRNGAAPASAAASAPVSAPASAAASPSEPAAVGTATADGQGSPGADPAASAPADAAAGPNAADVSFARKMIPHHLQALDMASLARTNAGDQWVRDLASRLAETRDAQVRELKGWLDAWGEEPLPRDQPMPGMQSAAKIAALAKASGGAFDRMFITMMIEHHKGAVALARSERNGGAFDGTKAMADSIATTGAAEIAEMKAYLAKLK
ncbi:DUF305 domain-containing protein [Microbispora oryzae]|nr:DUF305 domain-containing protein [Microbispora oryzae]